jgi:hypothetical protein
VMGEFAALWNTTDAIQFYVDKNHKWPRNWEALKSSLAEVSADYRGGDISWARDHVDVNFQLDDEKVLQPGDWYVHLKSNDIPGEERTANERLRNQFVSLRDRRQR